VLDQIVAHAREDAPDECCGLLVGAGALIDQAVRTTNVQRGPRRFQVDPAEHFALIKRLRGGSREIAGVYHSHPASAAVPSPSDLEEAFYPDFVYLIVSLAGAEPETRGWRIVEGIGKELTLVVES
jgi:proteasome lid subunit RPN8/RPN11